MNTAAKIKEELISKIQKTEDLDFLLTLQNIVETTQPDLYTLTPAQLDSINMGRKEIDEGHYYTNDEVLKDLNKWLENK